MSNVFVVRPIQAGLGFTSTDGLLNAITSVSTTLKGHTNVSMQAKPLSMNAGGTAVIKFNAEGKSIDEYVTEVFKLKADGKYVDDVSFVFLLGRAAALIRNQRDELVALAYSPDTEAENVDPVSVQIVAVLRKAMTKYRTPCTKSECSENCVMLEIRSAMDESL